MCIVENKSTINLLFKNYQHYNIICDKFSLLVGVHIINNRYCIVSFNPYIVAVASFQNDK
jgi:hypothetical protein